MEHLNNVNNSKVSVFLRENFTGRNLIISIVTLMIFSLYFYWIDFQIEKFIMSNHSEAPHTELENKQLRRNERFKNLSDKEFNDVVKKLNDYEKKMKNWSKNFENKELIGVLRGAFFISTFIFYFLHKKWNYIPIKKRRYVEMISKFLLLWILTNSIRGLVVAYTPNEQAIVMQADSFIKIFFEMVKSNEMKKVYSQDQKNQIKNKKSGNLSVTLNQTEDISRKWMRESVEYIRFLIFFIVGLMSSVFSIFSCFLFGVWGYLSKKYSISYEQIE